MLMMEVTQNKVFSFLKYRRVPYTLKGKRKTNCQITKEDEPNDKPAKSANRSDG